MKNNNKKILKQSQEQGVTPSRMEYNDFACLADGEKVPAKCAVRWAGV